MQLFILLLSFTYFFASGSDERPLVIVIPSYNNAQYYQKNLDSVFNQKYENYRVIYIDDCSPDGTYDLVKQYVAECAQEDSIILLKNKERRGALANHYKAVHSCADHEIIVQLDGDDWFAHEHVLARINKAYDNPHVWITYGQHEIYPTGERGKCRHMPKAIIKRHAYREYDWITSALRTFYAGLFKCIKLQDLLYEGDFFATACDLAFMYPMLEMASGKIKFIDRVLYIYNCETPYNDFKERIVMQLHEEHVIRSRPKYEPIGSLVLSNKDGTSSADLIIFSNDNPLQLYALIESVYRNMRGLKTITVLFNTSTKQYADAYGQCALQFPSVIFEQLCDKNFKTNLINIIKNGDSDYILLACDTVVVKNTVDVRKCIRLLQQTQAYGFFLSLGKNILWSDMFLKQQEQPYLIELEDGFYVWQYQEGQGDWCNYHNTLMTIYKKTTLYKQLKNLNFDSFETFEYFWKKVSIDAHNIGLCFENSKVDGVDLWEGILKNAQHKLVERFNTGKTLDFTQLYCVNNASIFYKLTPQAVYSLLNFI